MANNVGLRNTGIDAIFPQPEVAALLRDSDVSRPLLAYPIHMPATMTGATSVIKAQRHPNAAIMAPARKGMAICWISTTLPIHAIRRLKPWSELASRRATRVALEP